MRDQKIKTWLKRRKLGSFIERRRLKTIDCVRFGGTPEQEIVSTQGTFDDFDCKGAPRDC